jgi:quercetin dioxygenase-like cupin family protein
VDPCKIDFDRLPWQDALPGARYKVHREGARQMRLVEFTTEFVEPHWCEKGHIGMVLSGTLELDFQGKRIFYPEASGVFIPAGTAAAHKARAVSPVVRLVLVEDV